MKMFGNEIWTIIFALTTLNYVTRSDGKDPKRCSLDRIHKMIAYNCAHLDLTEIPSNLKKSTEILDASDNRIKRLTKSSFTTYPSLRFLYLFNNMILKIEIGTFSQLTLLETLDLSQNGLQMVPTEILNLPNLRKLYLADNDLENKGFESIEKPVKAPLVYLNIAATEIDKLPDLGILPDLIHLNISMNKLKHLKPEQFAPLCQLKHVDFNKTDVGDCDCHKINMFIEYELQKSAILQCGPVPAKCKLDPNSTSSVAKDYIKCMSVKEELIKTRSSEFSWPLVAFCSIIGLLFFIILYVHFCQTPKGTKRPQHIELSVEADMPINPDSRSTLIM